MPAVDLPEELVRWFRRRLRAWARSSYRRFPWRETQDPYGVLVAEVLLQQTDAKRVVPVYSELLRQYGSVDKLAQASVRDIQELLEPIGFCFRAKTLIRIAQAICEEHEGRVPCDLEELLALPGIGRYMACSTLATAFGRPRAVVDTNVCRVIERFYGYTSHRARPRNDAAIWEAAETIMPRVKVKRWNLALLDFGGIICRARKPLCQECPVRRRCRSLHTMACG